MVLLIHSGLVSFTQQGSPCLVKKTDRTKEELITELFKPENKALLKEYKINVNQLLINSNELPLQGDEDLKSIIRSSHLFKKEDLEKMGIYNISNGFKKSNGSIAYIPNDPLKDGYLYLGYKNVVYAALNCGNPALILAERRKVESIKRDTTFIYSEKFIVKTEIQQAVVHDTIYANFQPQVQQQQNCCGTMSAIHPMYNNGYSDNCCGMRTTNYNNCNSCYQQQVFVPQQVPSFGWGGYVSVNVNNNTLPPPPPQYRSPYRPARPSTPPPRYTPQSGGPVTPSHGGGVGPVTPNHGGTSGGPVTPNHRQ